MTLTNNRSAPQQSAPKGVALVMGAVILFALSDVTTKHLTTLYAVPLVIAGRYLVNLFLLLVILVPRYGRALFQTRRTGLVILRGLSLALAALSMGFALRYMPVGESVAISYIAPFGVMLLAVPLLGEKASLAGWICATMGFAGVLLIARPGSGLAPLGVVFALVNAAASVSYHLLSRVLARSETTMALLLYTALVGFAVFGAMLPWSLTGPMPTLPDLGLLLALGGFATCGHFLFTAAYREAPASMLAPVNYLHLVWAAIFGWIVFAHVPDALTLFGMALVALAGVMVALRTRTPTEEATE
jgi:drug/metabolite transporter (DMT)-like permease